MGSRIKIHIGLVQGQHLMNDMIRLIKPHISFNDIKQDFEDIFETGMHTKGKHVKAFTEEFCAYTGAKHCVFTTSATTALWTCLKLLNIGEGDEVLVADFSFPASANVVEDLGATPVFVDVSLDTYNMCPEDLKKKITNKTKAVMFVDALGNPTGLHDIQDICTAHNIPLIEDAACGIGSHENGVKVGNIADVTCFSFHPRKLMCTGEGGAITTNNDEWAHWLKRKMDHGADGIKGIALDFKDYGYNFRLPEIASVMGRKQLPMLDDVIKTRIEIQKSYDNGLKPLGFTVQMVGENAFHNIQSLAFMVPDNINRDDLIHYLRENNVESTIGTYCLSGTTYYANKYNDIQPNANALFEQVITLPCFPGVDTNYIIETISNYKSKAAA